MAAVDESFEKKIVPPRRLPLRVLSVRSNDVAHAIERNVLTSEWFRDIDTVDVRSDRYYTNEYKNDGM